MDGNPASKVDLTGQFFIVPMLFGAGTGALPQGPFEFIERLLSEPALYRQPGVWNDLMVLSAGRHRLKPGHFEQIGAIFRGGHYASYEDSDLCLAVCDFVARNFPHVDARELLEDLRGLEDRKPANFRGLADDGFQILKNEIGREGA
ncbi:hypothetical protein ACQUJT_17295 [Ralstonia pseudosolanacearum]